MYVFFSVTHNWERGKRKGAKEKRVETLPSRDLTKACVFFVPFIYTHE
jgi:hypothetical protein